MFNKRAGGILCHPTSFPSRYGIGDLGEAAFQFIDFLAAANQTLWQVLPLGPTGFGDSPYQSFSSFAGNHYLISIDELVAQGFLQACDLIMYEDDDPCSVDFGRVIPYKMSLFKKAFRQYKAHASVSYKTRLTRWVNKQADWLEDYALFFAIKEQQKGAAWHQWPTELLLRDEKAMIKIKKELEEDIAFCKFLQYEFHREWKHVKDYANKHGIKIIGDIPIFVAHDSSDVWANRALFTLDETGQPTAVAGVPPDYFSKTGQLWGNPLYVWDVHKKTDYAWWIRRMEAVLDLVDIVRIDHFRGFDAYWSIPAGAKNAIKGVWKQGPGKDFFAALSQKLGADLPIIAEDLGEITPSVDALRKDIKLPGMKVLHFAFDPKADSAFLPHNFTDNHCIVYSGTHDNDTSIGWYAAAPEKEKDYFRRYMNVSGDDVAWDLIRLAFSTIGVFAIVPIQDIMNLGPEHRMNLPGDNRGWWKFRYTAQMLKDEYAEWLRYLTKLYNR